MILPSPLVTIATAVLVSASMFGWGYLVGNGHGAAKVQQRWDHQMAKTAEEMARQQSQAREREHQLQLRADQKLKEKDREIAAVSRRAAALADSLRDRPEARLAPTELPQAAGAAAGCTGAGLARPDAEFLVGFAADAARLQLALDQCRAGYQAARDSLDGAAGEVSGRQAP